MLTNEQCIEIAEKVWGWEYVYTGGERYGGYWKTGGSGRRMGHRDSTKYEVLCWQGFGWTVEARDLPVYGDFRAKAVEIYNDYLSGIHSKEILWEQTHLLALEVAKGAE